ncbi:MAG: hypothetical protein ACLR8Y_10655 [Alistipes indistinctus]
MFGLRRDRANLVRRVKDYTLSEQEFNDVSAAGKEVKVTFTSANGKKVTHRRSDERRRTGYGISFERSTTLSQQDKEAMQQSHALPPCGTGESHR